MNKTTVTIPKGLLTSIPIGFLLSILIVFFGHLFGKWENIPDEKFTPPSNQISWYVPTVGLYNICEMGEDIHSYRFEGSETADVTIAISSFKVINSLSGTFDGHIGRIFVFGFILTFIIYFLSRLRFRIG